jgi:hypothetical protein
MRIPSSIRCRSTDARSSRAMMRCRRRRYVQARPPFTGGARPSSPTARTRRTGCPPTLQNTSTLSVAYIPSPASAHKPTRMRVDEWVCLAKAAMIAAMVTLREAAASAPDQPHARPGRGRQADPAARARDPETGADRARRWRPEPNRRPSVDRPAKEGFMQTQGMLPIFVAALLVGSGAAAQQAPIGIGNPR